MSLFNCVSPALYTIILTYGLLHENVYVSRFWLFNYKTYLSGQVQITLQSTAQCNLE